MINVIVVTHGIMAEGMANSVKMLIGEAARVDYVAFLEGMGADELKEELYKKAADISADNQYLIMCDILGGTPFNVASRLSYKNDNVSVFYGINLPILVEAIMGSETQTLEALTHYLQEIAAKTLGVSEI